MKILFTFGGLPHYYNLVLNKLNREEGNEVIVIVPDKSSNTVGQGVHQTDEGVEFKVYKLKEYRPWYGKVFFKGMGRIILNEKPDIIVTGWPYSLGFLLNPAIRLIVKRLSCRLILKEIPFGIPLFGEAKQFYLNGILKDEELNPVKYKNSISGKLQIGLITFIRKKLYNMVDAHVNYVEQAYRILGSYGVPKEKIFITYNSPDTEKLLNARGKISQMEPILKENRNRIIHVGRLVKWKKADLLIKAFVKVKKKFIDAELIIVGTGPEEDNLKSIAGELKLLDDIKFIGGIYDDITLGRYLTASSIYVLAGMGGLSINEAMCYDKPVICSVCDGTEKHLVFDEFNGKYFEEDNEDDLAGKIIYLLSDTEKIKTMGRNSGRIIKEKININTVVEGYLKAFRYVMNN